MGKGKNRNIFMFALNNKAMILTVLMLIVSVILTSGTSLTVQNMTGVMRQISVLAIISIGFTIILAGGMMDLSVGNVVSLCGICYGLASKAFPLWVAIILAILVGVTCEFLNGIMIRAFHLPFFVLTLATGQIFKGIAEIITDGKSVGGLGAGVKFLGQGRVFGFLPMPFMIMIVVVLLMAILLGRTTYGRHVLAAGGNPAAAEVSGIRVGFINITTLMIGGICFGMGSVVLTGRVASAIPTAGDNYLMDSIAAVVIGGTPMHGGKAKVIGTLFGVALIGVINNMLNLLNISSYWQWVCKGVIIIIAIILDSMTDRVFKSQKS